MIQIPLLTDGLGKHSQSADVSTLEEEILAAAFKPFPRIVADLRDGVVHSQPACHPTMRCVQEPGQPGAYLRMLTGAEQHEQAFAQDGDRSLIDEVEAQEWGSH
jgi:hypothetical protein